MGLAMIPAAFAGAELSKIGATASDRGTLTAEQVAGGDQQEAIRRGVYGLTPEGGKRQVDYNKPAEPDALDKRLAAHTDPIRWLMQARSSSRAKSLLGGDLATPLGSKSLLGGG